MEGGGDRRLESLEGRGIGEEAERRKVGKEGRGGRCGDRELGRVRD